MQVIEIFKSIEGEGFRAGMPATFIRLAGCNLRCSYCDTKYSYNEEAKSAVTMSPEEIVKAVKEYGCRNVTVTGGEPMIHGGITKLLDLLVENDFWVNIETNGSMPLYKEDCPHLLYTVDYKCPSSGMEEAMLSTAILNADVLKFVVGDIEDMERALEVIPYTHAQEIYFSPVFGKIELETIAQFLIDNHLDNCKMQVQLHKIIWDPDKRGV